MRRRRRNVAECKACGGPVIRWRALAIVLRMCPACDRLSCAVCKRVDLTGKYDTCCGQPLGNPNPIEGIHL